MQTLFIYFRPMILFLLLLILNACAADYGMVYNEEIVQENIVEEINVIGELGYEWGIAYDQAVDILFLVDESGSMGDNQDQLASTMPSLYDVLTGPSFSNLKWRCGITSTDDGSPIYAWVDYDDPNATVKLLTLTSFLGMFPKEAGLDAAVKHVAWDNTGFFRQDADLLLIYISDEAEQSTISVATYEQIMTSFKEFPFIVQESSIVYTKGYDHSSGASDYEDCDYNAVPTNMGTGYTVVSEAVVDLCDTDNWVDVLNPAKDHIPSLNQKWFLDDGIPVFPQTDHIEVWFDDVPNYDWYYQPADNSVNLFVIPPSGTEISIVYLVEPS